MFAFREKTVWIIAALALLLLAPQAAGAATQKPCNGSSELCERTLDKVALAGTHNSMSASELGWALPNQTLSISNQLRQGARSLLIDTYYGQDGAGDLPVASIPKAVGRETGADMYMCHAYCQLGSVDLTSELGRIKDFLVAKPREVLVIVNEDYIAPDDFARAVADSGLLPFVYQGPAGPWPTLGQMIDSGQRVVMLAQNEVGAIPWYHLGYDGPMMETPYSFGLPGLLTLPDQLSESCRPNRGAEGSPLFLMNHWVLENNVTPLIANAEIVNSKEAVVARARACEQRRGAMPTIIAVDYFGTGDVIGAVRELNGVSASPFLDVPKPRSVTVRAGRTAVINLKLSNIGDADATGVRIFSKLAGKLARKPKIVEVSEVKVDAGWTARISLVTRKTARGSGAVSFKIVADQGSLASASTKLFVKPLPKPKKRR